MRREMIRAFESLARHAAMQKGRSLFLCAAILVLTVLPAFGTPGRMVYVNGKLHRIWISSSYVKHQEGQPSDLVNGTGNFVATGDAQQGYYVCRATMLAVNEGLAVFNNKIYWAYTRDTTCGTSSAGQSFYVATFNLKTNAWERNYKLGTLTMNNNAYGHVSGAAITVFNSQLYAFSIGGVYTSGDGVTWTWHAALPQVMGRSASADYQPMDAVAIYPPNSDPKILIVFGTQFGTYGCSGGCNYFDTLYAEAWNGKFGSALQLYNPRNIYGRTDGSGPWISGRVSLMPGTKAALTSPVSYAAGNLHPAVQLFAQKMSDDHLLNLEYDVVAGDWRGIGSAYGDFTSGLMMYPWYLTQCDTSHPGSQSRRQRLVALGSPDGIIGFDSDNMVPKNVTDPILPPTCNGSTGGTATRTGLDLDDDPDHIRRDYWSLVGMVLGGPPFALNMLDKYRDVVEIDPMSYVSYGTSNDSTVKQSQQWTNSTFFSAGTTVHAGFFDEMLNVKSSFDYSYEHEYSSEHESKFTSETGTQNYFGTKNYSVGGADALGKFGWAVFLAPTVVVQDYKLYAYDYNYHTGVGTSLDQDLTAIEAKPDELSIEFESFALNPAEGPRDPIFAGLETFQDSSDLNYWANPKDSAGLPWNWDTDPRWTTVYGSGKVNPLSFAPNHNESETYFTQTSEQLNGSEETTSVEFKTTDSIEAGTKLYGIDVSFTAGTNSSFSTGVTTTTSFGTELKMNLGMATCAISVTSVSISSNVATFAAHNAFATGQTVTMAKFSSPYSFLNGQRLTVLPDGLSSSQFSANLSHTDMPLAFATGFVLPPECDVAEMSVQPFFLQANLPTTATAPVAPWVPTAYRNQQPWCIAWKVTNVNPPLSAGVASTVLGSARAATGIAPLNASGRIVSGTGGNDGGGPYSHYFIEGGKLEWVDANGSTERIPMTADDFMPSRGVSLEIHGSSWFSGAAPGSWTRSGDIWTFETDGSVEENRVMVRLDFGSATYDLQLQKANLARIPAGVRDLVLAITVNGQYTFLTALQHDIDIAWRWSKPAADNLTMHVTSFDGRYNSANQSGKMSLAGTLPAQLDGFGDIGVEINGGLHVAELVNLDGFQRAFETGGVIKYAKEGVIVFVDFGKKTWSATFNGKAFNQLLAPRLGTLSARILVGGLPLETSEDAVLDYSANLKLRR